MRKGEDRGPRSGVPGELATHEGVQPRRLTEREAMSKAADEQDEPRRHEP